MGDSQFDKWFEFSWKWQKPILDYIKEHEDEGIYVVDVLDHFAPTKGYDNYVKNQELRQGINSLLWTMIGPKFTYEEPHQIELDNMLRLRLRKDD